MTKSQAPETIARRLLPFHLAWGYGKRRLLGLLVVLARQHGAYPRRGGAATVSKEIK
jgi:hypothetical protein